MIDVKRERCGEGVFSSCASEVRHREGDLPRVLVISNNAFSSTESNGKTLASFFRGYPADKVAQLYFSGEDPSDLEGAVFLPVNETESLLRPWSRVLRSPDTRLPEKTKSHERMEVPAAQPSVPSVPCCILDGLRGSQSVRLVREVLWLHKDPMWGRLGEKLRTFRPEVVFFMGGDSVFAYRATRRISNQLGVPILLYLTDDYVLPGRWASLSGRIRRKLVERELSVTLKHAAEFLSISPKMRRVYRERFGRDSQLLMNMSMPPQPLLKLGDTSDHRHLRLVYGGGLHSNRANTLARLARAIRNYNLKHGDGTQAHLDIYTSDSLNSRARASLEVPGASAVHGQLGPREYAETLANADILVHVESFDRRSISVTQLSLSTKITEYLSMGKPILAIGPKEVASMEYLDGFAYRIVDLENLDAQVTTFLASAELREELVVAARENSVAGTGASLSRGEFHERLKAASVLGASRLWEDVR